MGFFLALRFLSILPVPGKALASDRQLGRCTAWYPLVGVLLGGLLLGCAYLCSRFAGPLVSAFLCLILWTLFTGALHLDGLADSFDALGAGGERKRRLEIMKDSRLGVFGVSALLLALIGKFALLSELIAVHSPGWPLALILAPAAGRWAMLLLLFAFPAASGTGLGRQVKAHVRLPQFLIGSAVALGAAALLLGVWGLLPMAAVGLAAALMGIVFRKILGGCSGDSYGAACELSELLCLLVLLILASRGIPR